MTKRAEKWPELRKMEILGFIAFGLLAASFPLSIIMARAFPGSSGIPVPLASAMLFLVYALLRYHTWRCPECGEYFMARRGPARAWTRGRHCVHCGTSRYVEDPA